MEFLSRYVIGRGVMSLEEGIRRMTGEAADRLGIKDRGYVKEGCKADLVLFSPEELAVSDGGNMGIRKVLVNGTVAVDDGRVTGALSGKVI